MRQDEPLQYIRDAVKLTIADVVLLSVSIGCFGLILVAGQIGYEPAGFAYWGAIAFAVWILNILNRLIGTIKRLYERILHLQRELDDLADAIEKDRQTRRVLPDELKN